MIRPYETRDCDELIEVWAAASAVAHPFLSEDFLSSERSNIRNVYLPSAETWVYEAEGRVVGFLSLLGNEVGAIFIDPRWHRSGIGRALMDHARGRRGALEVEVFEANPLGRAFYNKLGFEFLHRHVHEPTGFEVLRLRLPADSSSAAHQLPRG